MKEAINKHFIESKDLTTEQKLSVIEDKIKEAQLELLKEMYNDNRTWQEPLEVIEERMIDIMDKRINKVLSLDTNNTSKENK